MNRSDWLILNVNWARQIPDCQPSGHRNADTISNANTLDTGLILQLLHMEETMILWKNPNYVIWLTHTIKIPHRTKAQCLRKKWNCPATNAWRRKYMFIKEVHRLYINTWEYLLWKNSIEKQDLKITKLGIFVFLVFDLKFLVSSFVRMCVILFFVERWGMTWSWVGCELGGYGQS